MKSARSLAALAAVLVMSLAASSPMAAPAKATHDVDWLVKPAERAIIGSQFARAAVLYQGALALRPEDPALLWRLAEVYTMGGQFTLAQEAYAEWLKVGKDRTKTERAQSEISRLARAPAPFVEGEDNRGGVRQPTFALEAVNRARALERRKSYQDAIQHLQAALVMDSTLVGAYRLIGALYGRLKDPASEQAFYVRYLRQVPGGRLAGMVRSRLKANSLLGKVSFEASFPCLVFINRGILDPKRRTPFKDVVLPAGEYTAVFYSPQYHYGQKVRLSVKAGGQQVARADFGVLNVSLAPWARIRSQRPGSKRWRDLGLWDLIGLPAGRWRFEFKTDDGKKTMTKELTLKAGAVEKILRWD